MSDDYVFLIFFLLIVGLIVVFLIVSNVYKSYKRHKVEHDAKIRSFVMNTSLRYQQCKQLNDSYKQHFLTYNDACRRRVTVDTRRKVDEFDFYRELKNVLSTSSKIDVPYLENCITSNQHWYQKYLNAYKQLPGYRTEAQFYDIAEQEPDISYSEYVEQERLLSFPVLHPKLSFSLLIVVSYTSPKGNSHHERSMNFSLRDCKICLQDMERTNKEKDYRNDERRKMTPALRYEVLKRDNFRCTICGRSSDDGVKLHVDHIRPVSKGGRTEIGNLRTLCQDCNLGKSAKWDPDGIN